MPKKGAKLNSHSSAFHHRRAMRDKSLCNVSGNDIKSQATKEGLLFQFNNWTVPKMKDIPSATRHPLLT